MHKENKKPAPLITRGFGSDNHATCHPDILKSIVESNVGHAPSYGTDDWTLLAISEFQKRFGSKCDVHFVFNGTAANVLSLRAGINRFETALCSDVSHLHHDECGAPEFFAGKIVPIASVDGKLSTDELEKYMVRAGDQHYSQPTMVSITQPTELGTCYTIAEIQKICDWAKSKKMFVHVDGARLCNSVSFLKTNLKEMLTVPGVDIVSFGGTKNGLLFGEAVVILNSELSSYFKYIKKQSAQLPSKSRFIAAQFLAYFEHDLFLKLARHSHEMAVLLEVGLRKLATAHELAGPKIQFPVESNAVFVKIKKEHIKTLKAERFFYVWDEKTFVCRLMCSWDTQPTDIESFLQKYQELLT